MSRISRSAFIVFIAVILGWPTQAASTVLFDFDYIHATSKKGVTGADIEFYMEGLYGSDLSVSQKTTAVRGPSIYGGASGDADNSYLRVGKGKGAPAITINFGENPIDSFSLDFQLFKKAKSFSILADGELINQQTLTKAQKKTGLSGHQNVYFFDAPVHTLQFVGLKKNSFAIDNLLIDLPDDLDGGVIFTQGDSFFTAKLENIEGPFGDASTINQNAVPEPSSLLLFALALLALRARSLFGNLFP
jgi:PEP-CTERM motif-containing protein